MCTITKTMSTNNKMVMLTIQTLSKITITVCLGCNRHKNITMIRVDNIPRICNNNNNHNNNSPFITHLKIRTVNIEILINPSIPIILKMSTLTLNNPTTKTTIFNKSLKLNSPKFVL